MLCLDGAVCSFDFVDAEQTGFQAIRGGLYGLEEC